MNEDVYPCRELCGLGGAQPGSEEHRSAYRCALPGFSEQKWQPLDAEVQPRPFMGRLPIYGEPSLEDDIRWDLGETPDRPRDSHEDGCPGSWSRCAFVLSLAKYERILLDNGVIPNLLADRTHDSLVIEALQFLEAERIRARVHWNGIRAAAEAKT